MKGFIKQLLTNRLGIILATLNLCYMVSSPFFKELISKGNVGKFSAYFNYEKLIINAGSSNIIFAANFPSEIIASITDSLLHLFLPKIGIFENGFYQLSLFTFFMIFQWLLIGWTAKKIASAIQSTLD
ncbi:MAG TPA: hypothetical protein PKY59_10575 [Pyrinomonadaceae bacterium]|nr:hypothetical protein [Pyrinomonadaceae bacterium]